MCRIYLVRHGETHWNVAQILQGQKDGELTDKGITQAQSTQKRFSQHKLDAIYSSDLKRAKHTAEVIAQGHGKNVIGEPRLRETQFGSLDGKKITDMTAEEEYQLERLYSGTPGYCIPGGESLEQVQARVMGCLHQIATECKGRTVLVVSHGMAISLALQSILGIPVTGPRNFSLHNCAVNIIDVEGYQWTLETLGDTSHLV